MDRGATEQCILYCTDIAIGPETNMNVYSIPDAVTAEAKREYKEVDEFGTCRFVTYELHHQLSRMYTRACWRLYHPGSPYLRPIAVLGPICDGVVPNAASGRGC